MKRIAFKATIKKNLLCLALLFIVPALLTVQQLSAQITVKGKTSITADDFYYVTILSPKDSTVITFQFFDTPEFEMRDLKQSEFILQITSPLLYKTYSCLYGTLGNNTVIDAGYIWLIPEVKSLGEVEIVGTRPKLRFTEGKLVYNIQDNTDLKRLISLDDVLRRVPFLSVEENKISVFGKKNTIVLVNGVPPKNDNWELISPEEIKEIEIITNPSAEYNASGMAVVNIITHRKFIKGFNGQISGSISKAEFWRSSNNLQVGYATEKINMYSSMNYNPNKRRYIETYERYFPDGTEMFNTLNQERNTDKDYSILFGVDYIPHPKHTIGLQYQHTNWHPTRKTSNENMLHTNADVQHFETYMSGDLMNKRHIYDANYTYQIDSIGKKLSVNLGHVDFASHENNDINAIANGSASHKTTHAEGNIKLYTANIDYLHKTRSEFTGKAGLYFSHNQNNSFYRLTNGNTQQTDHDIQPYNGADIHENKFAGYLTGRKQWDKFHIGAGLRFEYVNYKNKDKEENESSRTYADLFPSLEIGYQANDKLQTNLSFSRKVQYPSFQHLDPSTQYVDTFTYYVGNVNLKPEYSYNVEMNVIYNGLVTLSLAYSTIKDPLNPYFVKRLNPNSMICLATAENLKSQDVWTASLSAPYQYKFWTMQNSIGVTYNHVKFESEQIPMDRKKAMVYLYTYQGIKFPLDFNLSAIYQYNSSGVSGVFYHKGQHILNCALNKSLLNGKLVLTLKYDDVFKSNKPKVWTEMHNIRFAQGMDYDSSSVTLSVKYNFGQSTRKYQIKENSKEEMKRIN